jgi:hypothetical protein
VTSGVTPGLIAGTFTGLFGAGSTVQAWHAWTRPFWRPVGRVSGGRRRGAVAFALVYDSFALAIAGAVVAEAASGGGHLTGHISQPGVAAGLVLVVIGVLGFFAGVVLFWLIVWFNRPAFLVSPWLRWQLGTAAGRLAAGPVGRRIGRLGRRWLARPGGGLAGRRGVTGEPGCDCALLAYRALLPVGGPRGPVELLVDGVARAELPRGQSVFLTLVSGPHRIELASATWRVAALEVGVRPGEVVPLLCRPASGGAPGGGAPGGGAPDGGAAPGRHAGRGRAGRRTNRGVEVAVLSPPGPPTA